MTAIAVTAQAVEADKVAPGTIGFLIVAAIGVALWFLMRSMNKQLHKIDFKDRDEAPEQDGDQEQDEAPTTP